MTFYKTCKLKILLHNILLQKLSELQEENAKVCKDISEKNASLIERDEGLSALKLEITTKEKDVSNLSSQIESLGMEISSLTESKQQQQILHDKLLNETKEQFESELKIKDSVRFF